MNTGVGRNDRIQNRVLRRQFFKKLDVASRKTILFCEKERFFIVKCNQKIKRRGQASPFDFWSE